MKNFKLKSDNRGVIGIVSLLFLIISTSMVVGVASILISEASVRNAETRSRQSFFSAESSVEDVVYRVRSGMPVSSVESFSLNGAIVTTAVSGDVGQNRTVTSSGDRLNAVRSSQVELTTGVGAAFFYGVQAGEGGIIMENSSSILGNVYSNGPVVGSGTSIVRGSVVSAGPTGSVNGVEATSSIYAKTIQNSYAHGNAYYQTISGSTVLGTSYPGSANQPTSSMPIGDSLIEEWKLAAAEGGIITSPCPMNITSSTSTGPFKIACDVTISGTPTVTLNGPIWVEGTLKIQNSSVIKANPSLGAMSIPVIADKESDRLDGSRIEITNSAVFQGSGATSSYVLLISNNNSAQNGGSVKAIDVSNFVSGSLLVYAPYGEIQIQNNIGLNEVTAYKIRTKNSAEVVYKTGLANLLFSSGPGGGYEIDSWLEVE